MSADPTGDEVTRVHRFECSILGHRWQVIESLARGPVAVVCAHCGESIPIRGESVAPLAWCPACGTRWSYTSNDCPDVCPNCGEAGNIPLESDGGDAS